MTDNSDMRDENNTLFARFMEFSNQGNIWTVLNEPVFTHELQFDWNWNWLMDVVEKIETLGFNFQIESRFDPLWIQMEGPSHVLISRQLSRTIQEWSKAGVNNSHDVFILNHFKKPNEKLKSVYDTALEFIQWYNQQKK
jgi:hypothetical protein